MGKADDARITGGTTSSPPALPPGYWRRHVYQRRIDATRETPGGGRRDFQPDAREGQAGPPGESDRPIVPWKPGNAGGGKEPDFGCVVEGAKSLESGHVAYNLHQGFGGLGRNCANRRKTGLTCLCAGWRNPSESRMREIRPSGSMSGRWKRRTACGSEPRRGNPDTRTYRCLTHRATSRLYVPWPIGE